MVYVRSTFRYRTISEFQSSSQILRLVFCFWHLLASFVYSARILEEFHLMRLLPCILMIHIHRLIVTANHLSMDYWLIALPLRDREVTTNFTIRFITHNDAYCFMVWTHHQDLRVLTSGLPSCYLLLRNGWHSISGVKALTNITNGAFILLPARGHQFLLNMFTSLYSYGLLYTLFLTSRQDPFPRDVNALQDSYYPIRVRLSGSLSILVCIVSNQLIMAFFCSGCQGTI